MSDYNDNIYEKVARKYQNNPTVVFLFIASFTMLAIGCWLFVEDTVSSKIALQNIQQNYGVQVQIFALTYWIMSLAPQVASIVFMYMFVSSSKDYKWLAFALIAQAADFIADMWYRGNGAHMLSDPMVFMISGLMTLLYFSVGSEFFITIGFGLVLKLANPALRNFKQAYGATRNTYTPSTPSKPSYTPPANQASNKSQYQPKNKPPLGPIQTQAKPQATASTRPLYNEPTYHPVDMNAKPSDPKKGESLPPWMPTNYPQ